MTARALYIHIPFCASKCLYCDFDSRPLAVCGGARAYERYMDQLISRIAAFGECGALGAVKTVYVGGGTPTVLGSRLRDVLDAVLQWCSPVEFSCEANPESFDGPMAALMCAHGVTRVSLGVQSLNDDELHAIGRLHTTKRALEAVSLAQSSGLSVSCDLMCGLPGQTLDSWAATIDRLIATGPDHVSVYPLSIEEGTPLAHKIERGVCPGPDEDLQADAMEMARAAFSSAGLEPYEVASYARPGAACRHNIAYWTGVEYLGIGRSAAGMLDRATFEGLAPLFGDPSLSDMASDAARIRFVQCDDAASSFEWETLALREAVAEDLMLACRMTRGIPHELLVRARGIIPAPELEAACARAVELGLASWTRDGGLAPTRTGWLEGNELFGLFWGLAR